MDLTSAFNAAAAGPSSDGANVSGSPAPKGPAPSAAEQATSEATSAKAETASNDFAQASTNLQNAQGTENLTSNTLDVANAEAELEALEVGRAEPARENNLNPPRRLKKIVDSQVERQRESRIGALKAYLEFRGREAEHQVEAEHTNGPDYHL